MSQRPPVELPARSRGRKGSMSLELKILSIPTSAKMTPDAFSRLTEMNCVVIQSDSPELVRLVSPTSDIDLLPANEFVWAALDALAMSADTQYSEPDADKLRRKFVRNLSESADRKRRKLIGWSNPEKEQV